MQLFKNTLWLTLSFTISRGISIFWNIYLARTFSTSLNDLGVYMYIMAQFSLFSILAEGNISYTFQHFISKEFLSKDESVIQYWTFSFYAKFVLGVVFGLALYLIIINQYPDYQFTAFLVSITLLVFNIGAAPIGIFIAHNDFKVQIVSYLINSLFFATFSIFAIMFTKNINIIIGILLFSNVTASSYSLYAGIKLYGLPKKHNDIFNLTKKILKFSAPLLVASFCFSFFYRMDINIIAGKMTANYVSYISIALMFFF